MIRRWFGLKPQPSVRERFQEGVERQADKGHMNRCTECGKVFLLNKTTCPRCHWEVGKEGRSTQFVHVYMGSNPEKEFAQDATELGALGWRVANQSQGGVNTWQIGRKHPTNITVTYIRD